MNDPATTLDRIVAKAGQLYSLPAVAMKVLQLTNNPQVDTHALKECIENDPALTGKILRVVNSSLFGLTREVSDLNQALAMMGTKPLKLLVLGFSLPDSLFAGVAGGTLQQYWRHTLTKAVAGREISETLWNTAGDEAFIAGLLQDIGILLLIRELGEPYVKFLDKVSSGGQDLAALEAESMGFDHTTVSARLLATWGLPHALVQAVAQRPAEEESTSRPAPDEALPEILHLAELFARLLADEQSEVLHQVIEVGGARHGLSQPQMDTLAGNLQEKVAQLADVLCLQLPDGLDYRDVLVKAQSQLAEAAAEAAEDLLRAPPQNEESLLDELQGLAKAVATVSGRPTKSSMPGRFFPPTPQPVDQAPAPQAAAKPAASSVGAATATAEVDPGLLGRIAVAVAACRQSRCPLSLLMIQIDGANELAMTLGLQGLAKLREFLAVICQSVQHPAKMCLPHDDTTYALVLPDCEKRLAIELGNQLIENVQRFAPAGQGHQRRPIGVNVGVATVSLPPRNFPAEDLFASAQRCLYGSQASGGSVVKSIEIY